MNKCQAIKQQGGRCERLVTLPQRYCWAHDPLTADDRKRYASQGGKARAKGEIGVIKAQLKTLAAETREGKVDKSTAAIINQILNTLLNALRTEMKQKELEELETRLAELEMLAESRLQTRGGRFKR